MKDVVGNEIKKENNNFIKLLTKICLDLGINNYKTEIENLLKNKEKQS